ncbi:hypothetical protein BDV12DRAFT_209018 [Aspergillus spectabilis]
MATFTPSPPHPPDLHIPPSSSTVTVRVIDSTTTLHLNPPLFWAPEIPGLTGIDAPALCFLISHETQNRHVLFDLGVRKDWENYAPITVDLINRTTRVTVEKGVAEILDEQYYQNEVTNDSIAEKYMIRSTDIEAIIWSHHHFDHVGDPSTFPPTTSLIVGPGVKNLAWPGYPSNETAAVLDSDILGRNVAEINFTSNACKIGRFNAADYFGDGSFYILDAPGHSVGHLCALARVTSDADSFVFMGGDAAHHPGLLRPSIYLPLPDSIHPSPFTSSAPCTRELLQRIHPQRSLTEPYLRPARGMFPAYDEAEETLRKIQEFDAQGNILVILPHDRSILGAVEMFQGAVNGWLEQGVKERVRWAFLGDFEGAL